MLDFGSICGQALVCSISDQLLKTTANLVKQMWSRGIQADILHDPVAPMQIMELNVIIQILGAQFIEVHLLIFFVLKIALFVFFMLLLLMEEERNRKSCKILFLFERF